MVTYGHFGATLRTDFVMLFMTVSRNSYMAGPLVTVVRGALRDQTNGIQATRDQPNSVNGRSIADQDQNRSVPRDQREGTTLNEFRHACDDLASGIAAQVLQYSRTAGPCSGPGVVRIKIGALPHRSSCGRWRATHITHPIVPGHEVVGRIDALGHGISEALPRYASGFLARLNPALSIPPGRQGKLRQSRLHRLAMDGGFIIHLVADARTAFRSAITVRMSSGASLLCAGLIGWRSLSDGRPRPQARHLRFGATGHRSPDGTLGKQREVYAFTRTGDASVYIVAGACWAGSSEDRPPAELDAAIIYRAGRPLSSCSPCARCGRAWTGDRAGIHTVGHSKLPYSILWGERQIVSVANLTSARRQLTFSRAQRGPVKRRTKTT